MHAIPEAGALVGWFKSSYSGGANGECLEVASGYAFVPVRDSKTADGPVLVFSATGWSSFLTAIKNDQPSA
ncbi:DUF397 domain-containing protein [Streptomyces sp. NBC_01218]|uniref:DUF397 domain-containing protein n=1 Tax=unclassified Streptomyces TaxID=2593676 RepID=UPI002E1398B3|nr:DUF397 domain-containing protein [Streptomyces sp. NBC_01218]